MACWLERNKLLQNSFPTIGLSGDCCNKSITPNSMTHLAGAIGHALLPHFAAPGHSRAVAGARLVIGQGGARRRLLRSQQRRQLPWDARVCRPAAKTAHILRRQLLRALRSCNVPWSRWVGILSTARKRRRRRRQSVARLPSGAASADAASCWCNRQSAWQSTRRLPEEGRGLTALDSPRRPRSACLC